MSNFIIYSNTSAKILYVKGNVPVEEFSVKDINNQTINVPLLGKRNDETLFDASYLETWSPENPVIYVATINNSETIRFGFTSLKAENNSMLKLNDAPFYARGYIRGIIAHDHPNMTGKTLYDAAVKNICQAKKYGFNLVRFHSTIPTADFVKAAEDYGMLIHMEIGFTYKYRADGVKESLKLDDTLWKETILRYRNSPAVAIFCIGNEMHNSGKQPEALRLYNLGKELAPGKLIMDNSGWGEYDRCSADVFSQHIAYFFPYANHKDMFESDACWHLNGSAGSEPMVKENSNAIVRRYANPLRPVLSHEAVHYIEMPDYDALNAKFDAFAKEVGPEYLEANELKKPKFMTELPRIIREKNLLEKMPDYIASSMHFKKLSTKVFLETMRLSAKISGFEMLQFSDCFKYENKNGIVDCFDDDKDIDPEIFKQSNDSTVLLCNLQEHNFWANKPISFKVYLSHYNTPENQVGNLKVSLISNNTNEELENGNHYVTTPGVNELISVTLPKGCQPGKYTIKAKFTTQYLTVENSWDFWVFDTMKLNYAPTLALTCDNFANFINQSAPQGNTNSNIIITNHINEELFENLNNGKTVLLCYTKDNNPDAKWILPGSFDRLKPCIWDRGTHLGGIIYNQEIKQALGNEKYFNLHMQPLVDEAYKVNLDKFPGKVEEMISIIDKPVRDRMNSLKNIKEFQKDRILRNYSSLFAVKCNKGLLVISTFNYNNCNTPVGASFYETLINMLPTLKCQYAIDTNDLKSLLEESKNEPEDVMTRFWELDNKAVEDVLFWEEMGIDLRNLKR